jgi:ZIP family zinc transporter
MSAIVLSLFAGLAMPLGGLLARFENIRNPVLHDRVLLAIVAFGGGALISAVALVLIPHATGSMPHWAALALMVAGGVTFYLVDRRLAQAGGGKAMLLAMLLDFLPEAMALGALLVTHAATAKLLAVMIFLQGLPEGFASFRAIRAEGKSSARDVLLVFVGLALLGPICAVLGFRFLDETPQVLGGIMIFAAGGILYLVFQDIAPDSHETGLWSPALGAVAGFTLGLAGHLATG